MISFYLLGAKKILGFLKKALIVIAIYFTVISLFLHFLNKDKPKVTYDPIQKNREEIYKVINDPKLKSTQEGKIAIALYRTMLCGLIGEACTDNPKDGDKNFHHSVFGFITNLIALPYANPPASGVYWVYSGLQNAGFVPKTYAAEGIGFAAIKPFMNIWKVFRDISYMLLVLVLIAIGFMIMFRSKINPQAVISVENSLPKIVVALLLITFSFPIAGFLIDLMYVVIALSISVLAQANSNLNVGQLQRDYLTASPGVLLDKLFFLDNQWVNNHPELKLFTDIFKPLGLFTGFINFLAQIINIGNNLLVILPDATRGLLDLGALIFSGWAGVKLAFFLGEGSSIFKNLGVEAATFGANIGELIPGLIKILGFIVAFFIMILISLPLIIGLLVAFTLLFLFFRIFFILLTSYIKILLYILLSPLVLILEAIPGKNAFSSWFKNMLGELATFPLVVIVILLGNLIITTVNLYSWPVVGVNQTWSPPFLYNLNQEAWQFLIGYGIVLIIPDLIKLFKESLGAKGMGVEIGLGTFFGGLGAAYGGGMGALQQFSSLLQVPGIGSLIAKTGAGRWLKQQLIPPAASEIQLESTLTQLQAMLAGATSDQEKQEIEKLINKTQERLNTLKGLK
mgnify:CR=1 FL=1